MCDFECFTVATPKQIRELMKVDGLTNDEVKSHLQVNVFLFNSACMFRQTGTFVVAVLLLSLST